MCHSHFVLRRCNAERPAKNKLAMMAMLLLLLLLAMLGIAAVAASRAACQCAGNVPAGDGGKALGSLLQPHQATVVCVCGENEHANERGR